MTIVDKVNKQLVTLSLLARHRLVHIFHNDLYVLNFFPN